MKDLTWIKKNDIAHRGLHSLDLKVPENSLLAFKKAVEQGYSIEMDLNMLKDGTIVVIHDFNFKRLTGLDQKANQLNYEDIKDLRLHHTNEKIPTLKEVLELVDGKVPLLIELKPFGHINSFCHHFYEVIKDYPGKWAVFSFNPVVVRWFKKNQPQIIRGQISKFFTKDDHLFQPAAYMLKRMVFNTLTKPDFISYNVHDMPNKYIDKYKKKGLTIISFAARNQEELDFVRTHYDNIVFEYFIPKK